MDPSKSTVRERVWLKSRNLQTAFPRGWMCPCACVHVKINKFVSLQKCSFNLLSDDEHDEDNDNTRQSTWPQGRDHLPPKSQQKIYKHPFPNVERPTAKQGHIAVAGKNAKFRFLPAKRYACEPGSCPAEAEQRWKVATEPEKWLNYKLSTPAGHPRWHQDEGQVREWEWVSAWVWGLWE